MDPGKTRKPFWKGKKKTLDPSECCLVAMNGRYGNSHGTEGVERGERVMSPERGI